MDTAAPTFAPGSSFAGYRIESVAGRGGMGIVYRATQLALGRPVALKLLATQYAADEDFRERFKREWETAAAIDHPNVIPLYEAGEAQAHLFLAMRYVDGVDLANLITRDPSLDATRSIRILAQIASALDAAHARGLVHRDVKPANVLMGAEDHVYLTDFGLSRGTAQSRLTRTGLFVGTTDYAAPEQVRGEDTDARTDVYALGCVLYQLLTRAVPFDRAGDMATMYAHITEPPPLVTTLRPDLPAAFDEVVAYAMAKEPADRYQSAGDLARAAAAVLGMVTRAEAPPVVSDHRAGWDTAPVGLASIPNVSAAPPAGPATGWAATPAGGGSSAEATAPVGAAPAAPTGAATPPLGFASYAQPPARQAPSQPPTGYAAPPAGRAPSQPPTGYAAAPNGHPAPSPTLPPTGFVAPATPAPAPNGFAVSSGNGGPPPAPAPSPFPASQPAAPASFPPSAPAPAAAVLVGQAAAPADEKVSPWPHRRRVALGIAVPIVLIAGLAAAALAATGVLGGGDDKPAAQIAPTATAIATATATATPASVEAAKAIATINVGEGPDGLAVSEGRVFVANQRETTLSVVDAASNKETGDRLEVGARPDGVVAGKGVVWVGGAGTDTARRIEVQGDPTVTAKVKVGDRPEAISLGKQLVWVANRNDGTVSRIDRASATLLSPPIGVGPEPAGIFVGRKFVWVTDTQTNTVQRIDPSLAVTVGEAIPTGKDPRGVIETGDSAWIVNAGDGTVLRLDRKSGKRLQAITVGRDPRQIALGFGSLWVTNHKDNSVTRIDERTGRIVGSAIPVGEGPLGITVGSGSVWVANHESHTVTRIQP